MLHVALTRLPAALLTRGTRHTDEADDFVKLLDSRELAASADEGLLVHLLLRADSINRKHLDWRRLKVGERGRRLWGQRVWVGGCCPSRA
jgi:hypothetical protein